MSQSVKIISGWSNPGGSTIHHIALTNLLNENGYDCTFYGPQEWHLDKCKSGTIAECQVYAEDIVISHFLVVPPVEMKKHILSIHETNLWRLKEMAPAQYAKIQYVSNFQREWHDVKHPSVIIPPVVEKFDWVDPKNNTAGVIGSIDEHKQTHQSIERALADGYEKVLLYGQFNDREYFDAHIKKHLESGKVQAMNHEDSRERMYGSVAAVYHSSKRETFGLVQAECKLSGVPYNGPDNKQEILTKEEILERWKRVLDE